MFITVRNEVAKVMLLQVCVCPQWGGSASVHAGIPTPRPPGADTPSGPDTPPDQAPPESRHPPPRERRILLRTVRILLECILVAN